MLFWVNSLDPGPRRVDEKTDIGLGRGSCFYIKKGKGGDEEEIADCLSGHIPIIFH